MEEYEWSSTASVAFREKLYAYIQLDRGSVKPKQGMVTKVCHYIIYFIPKTSSTTNKTVPMMSRPRWVEWKRCSLCALRPSSCRLYAFIMAACLVLTPGRACCPLPRALPRPDSEARLQEEVLLHVRWQHGGGVHLPPERANPEVCRRHGRRPQ